MWPLIGIALLMIGAVASSKKKGKEPGPLEEAPSPEKTAQEAIDVASDALDRAAAAAKSGDIDGATSAKRDADSAASNASGTSAANVASEIARQVDAAVRAAAAKAGVAVPANAAKSPGLPVAAPEEDEEPEVVVEPAPAPGKPLPPPPATKSFPDLVKSLPIPDVLKKDVEEIVKALPIPISLPKTGEVPALEAEETKADLDPNGTIKLARELLVREQSTGWRESLKPQVSAWQSRVGITADGKFGPGSAGTMASEVGVLPRIRFWPSSSPSKSQALQKYRNDISTKAANLFSSGKKEHAAALNVSAAAEDARAFGNSNPAPVSNAERLSTLEQLTKAVA